MDDIKKRVWINKIKKYRTGVFFAATFLLCFALTELLGEVPMYDAAEYLQRGIDMWASGRPTMNIDGNRGFFFPLCLGFFYKIGNGNMIVWQVANSAFTAFLFTCVLPGFFEDSKSARELRCIVLLFLYFFFCYGTGVNISSDTTALGLCLYALALTKTGMQGNISLKKRYLYFLFAGGFIYIAYNVRTIYLFSLITFLILLVIKLLIVNKNRLWGMKCLAANCAGVILAGIPQWCMNVSNTGKGSFVVQTGGLFSNQLYWGLVWQRYDTTTSDALGTPRMYFMDSVGGAITQAAEIGAERSYLSYFKLYLKYPLEMIGIYFRHLYNMLFPIYPENFINNISANKVFHVVLFFTVLFIVLYAALTGSLYKRNLALFLPMLMPCILIIPGSVEQRFALGIYIFIFLLLTFRIDYKKLFDFVKRRLVLTIIIYIVAFGTCLTIWTNTLMSLYAEPPVYPIFIEGNQNIW